MYELVSRKGAKAQRLRVSERKFLIFIPQYGYRHAGYQQYRKSDRIQLGAIALHPDFAKLE